MAEKACHAWHPTTQRGLTQALGGEMNYADGSEIQLGDLVSVPVPAGSALARVVMLGASREHVPLDPGFLKRVQSSPVLAAESVVIEWEGENPFAHQSPSHAPVGNYMLTAVDESVGLKRRRAGSSPPERSRDLQEVMHLRDAHWTASGSRALQWRA
jgi:hypothetical protein